MAEILLKVVLNTINQTKLFYICFKFQFDSVFLFFRGFLIQKWMRRIINNEQRDLYIGLSENVRNMAECASIPSESDDDEDIRDDKLSNFSIKKQTSYRYVYTPLYPLPFFCLYILCLHKNNLICCLRSLECMCIYIQSSLYWYIKVTVGKLNMCLLQTFYIQVQIIFTILVMKLPFIYSELFYTGAL